MLKPTQALQNVNRFSGSGNGPLLLVNSPAEIHQAVKMGPPRPFNCASLKFSQYLLSCHTAEDARGL